LTGKILLVGGDINESKHLGRLLKEQQYKNVAIHSLSEAGNYLRSHHYTAVILDIDSLIADNRTIRDLSHRFPEVYWLCTSREKIHPELSESFRHHIYACISKPLDPDELFYWLRCITENGPENRGTAIGKS